MDKMNGNKEENSVALTQYDATMVEPKSFLPSKRKQKCVYAWLMGDFYKKNFYLH